MVSDEAWPDGPPYRLTFSFSSRDLLEALDAAYPDDEYPELDSLQAKARRAWGDAYRQRTDLSAERVAEAIASGELTVEELSRAVDGVE